MTNATKRFVIFLLPALTFLGLAGMFFGVYLPLMGSMFTLPVLILSNLVAAFFAWRNRMWWGMALNTIVALFSAFVIAWVISNIGSMH